MFVRDVHKARSRFGDRVDIFVGDLASRESLTAALEGIDDFFLVNSGPQIPFQDELASSAAKAAGVKHLVKLSSMDVQQGLAIGAWHERGEAAIRASGIPFTFVRPTGFMSNLLAWVPSIKAEGVETCASAVALGSKFAVDLPIIQQMHAVLNGSKDPKRAIRDLMDR